MASNGVSGPHGSDRTGPPDPPPQVVDLSGVTFVDVLRAINPLQYMPVVGTIYRVATGDVAPSGLRTAVSAIVGVLTGGPVGLFGCILGSLAEQYLHVEGRLREALVAPGAGAGPGSGSALAAVPASPVGPASARPEPTHARAEADLGQLPAAALAQVVTAYRAAGLLGAV